MADALKPATSDPPPPPPAKPRKPKPPSRRDSQRARDKKERDSFSEIEETIKQIGSHKGIIGTVICNGDGIPLRSTLDKATTLQYAAFLTPLAGRAKIITKSHNPKAFKNKSGGRNSVGSVFGVLTRLRQMAVHPELPFYRKRQAYQKALDKSLTKLEIGKLIKILDSYVGSNPKCSSCETQMDDGQVLEIATCEHFFCQNCAEEFELHGCRRSKKCRQIQARGSSLLLSADVLVCLRDGREYGSTSRNSGRPRSSPKFEKLLDVLKKTPTYVNENGVLGREKTLIFSQWTACLDLLEPFLEYEGYRFQRIDETMPQFKRANNLKLFETDPEVSIILLSTMATSTGLNIAFANHVVNMDYWWNPTVEDQGVDRCHRIGQKREVHVTRLMLEGSIEEMVMQLQEKKRTIVAEVMYSKSQAMGKKDGDLNFLMKGIHERLARCHHERARAAGEYSGYHWESDHDTE